MKVDGSPISDRMPTTSNSPVSAVGRVLRGALQWWLRSQLDHLDSLHIDIHGSNRQIFSGQIPQVVLTAENATYRGIALHWVRATAHQIHLQIGDILRGHPLVLSETISACMQVQLTEADLNTSLDSGSHSQATTAPSLLAAALFEVLQTWWQSTSNATTRQRLHAAIALFGSSPSPETFPRTHIQLQPNGLIWEIANSQGRCCRLQTQLQATTPSQLRLAHPRIQIDPPSPWLPLEEYSWDLGTDVAIEELTLDTGRLAGSAQLLVRPATSLTGAETT
jgi:hypothetical protein